MSHKIITLILTSFCYLFLLVNNISAQTCNFPIGDSNLRDYGTVKSLEIGGPILGKMTGLVNDSVEETKLLKEFSFAVSPVFMARIQPTRNTFNYLSMNKDIEVAKQYNLKLKGDSLIFGTTSISPGWLGFTDTSCGSWTNVELDSIMKDHIQKIVTHGGSNYSIWEVVNEPFDGNGNLYRCWYKILGREYIANAFRYADQARPNKDIKLMLNEHFGWTASLTEDKPKIDAFINLVKELKNANIPLDILGIQLHLRLDGLSQTYIDEINYFLTAAQSLQLPVHITEMDVYQGVSPMADWEQLQKNVYKNIVATCLKYSNCKSFSTWGISDKSTWLNSINNFPNPKPLLFDTNYLKKPAYFGVVEAISEDTFRTCTSKPGDLNNDGSVNIFDYNILISKFGNPYTYADFDLVVINYGK